MSASSARCCVGDDSKQLGFVVRHYEERARLTISGIRRERSGAHYFNARRLGACSTTDQARRFRP
jgi:hypothetical protein